MGKLPMLSQLWVHSVHKKWVGTGFRSFKNPSPLICLGGHGAHQRVCLALSVLFLLISDVTGAQTLVRVPQNLAVEPGDQFMLSIEAVNAPPLLSYFFKLQFSEQLEFLSAQEGALTPGWGVQYGASATTATVGSFSSQPASGTGSLVRLRFRAKATAPNGHVSPLAFDEAELNDGVLPVTTQDGTVRISRTVIVHMPTSVRAGPGEELAAPVHLDDGSEVLSYFLQFSYDGSVLEFLGVDAGGTLPAGWGTPEVNSTLNRITVAAYGTTALTGAPRLATLRFRVRPETRFWTETWVTCEDAEFNDGLIDAVTDESLIDVIDPTALPLRGAWAVVLGLVLGLIVAVYRYRVLSVCNSNRRGL